MKGSKKVNVSDRIFWARFWSKVNMPSDFQCWEWRASTTTGGYGRIDMDDGIVLAHRVAYEMLVGPIPDGLMLRHHCDNPRCVNPRHLIPGTAQENSNDAVFRGRTAVGAKNGRTKLSDEQVDYIRRNPDRIPLKELARKFGVAASTVSLVRSGKRRVVVGGTGVEPVTDGV